MTQPRSRNVRFEPPQAAVGKPADTAPALDTVTLSDGRLAKLRRLSGLDQTMLEQSMEQAGFVSLSGPGQATYLRCCAAYALLEINGQMQKPPDTGEQLKTRLASLLEEDWALLIAAYLKLAGMVPADKTFPAADGETTR